MPTEYYNPTTRRWESREELGERPATAETVIASEADYMGRPADRVAETPFGTVRLWGPPHPPGG